MFTSKSNANACFSYPNLKKTRNEAASNRDWSLVVDSTLLKFISGSGSYTYSVSAVLYMRVMDKGMIFISCCHVLFAVVCFLGLVHGVLWSWTWFHIMQDQGYTSRCRSLTWQWQIGILPHPCTRFVHINAFEIWVFLYCIVMSVDLSVYIFPTTTRCLMEHLSSSALCLSCIRYRTVFKCI